MKSKESLAVFLIFFVGMSLYPYAKEGLFQKKKPKAKETKSLIRKELLLKERKKLEPPRRIIFSPRSLGLSESQVNSFRTGQNLPESSPETPAALSENRSLAPSNIRYIGYIHSEGKIVGLIFFEGIALAVEEGEMISAGVKIGKITLKEIEIIGPDSEIRKYSLEGEKE